MKYVASIARVPQYCTGSVDGPTVHIVKKLCSKRNASGAQLYRVEVKMLPPEQEAAPRSRSVLRRFSHFQKLHRMVTAKRSHSAYDGVYNVIYYNALTHTMQEGVLPP